jgi:hypothetical protein
MPETKTEQPTEFVITEEMFSHPVWDAIIDFMKKFEGVPTLRMLSMSALGVCQLDGIEEFIIFGKDDVPAVTVRKID